jgi:putative ATPase
MADAERLRRSGRRTILFVDEIHRFNKAQQDGFLPWVENGTITLIGATTENPSFHVNRALLSRLRVYVLEPLSEADLGQLIRRAGEHLGVEVSDEARSALIRLANGDARSSLNILELAARAAATDAPVTGERVREAAQRQVLPADRDGEEHFNLISALHKSIRNSDADAGLYWLGRMLGAGEDPLYLARRLVRIASEDIGVADPEALRRALDARDAVHFLGMPEGALALAQAVIQLAAAPKSNSVYRAWQEVEAELAAGPAEPVPIHLRNAPTDLMKSLDYGKDYRYAHDEPEGVAEMECLPARLSGHRFYRGLAVGSETELLRRLEEARRKRG